MSIELEERFRKNQAPFGVKGKPRWLDVGQSESHHANRPGQRNARGANSMTVAALRLEKAGKGRMTQNVGAI